jgi:hypothetical protein
LVVPDAIAALARGGAGSPRGIATARSARVLGHRRCRTARGTAVASRIRASGIRTGANVATCVGADAQGRVAYARVAAAPAARRARGIQTAEVACDEARCTACARPIGVDPGARAVGRQAHARIGVRARVRWRVSVIRGAAVDARVAPLRAISRRVRAQSRDRFASVEHAGKRHRTHEADEGAHISIVLWATVRSKSGEDPAAWVGGGALWARPQIPRLAGQWVVVAWARNPANARDPRPGAVDAVRGARLGWRQ